MNILVDIDGTVCEDIPNEESELFAEAEVLENAVESVNKLYNTKGNTVTFFTSRTEEHREVTEKWLKKHKFLYHGLIMNKPRGGNYVWIDNLDVSGVKYDAKINDWKNITVDLTATKSRKYQLYDCAESIFTDPYQKEMESKNTPMTKKLFERISSRDIFNKLDGVKYEDYMEEWEKKPTQWENVDKEVSSSS
jgi:hypothetical protein